MLGIQMNVSGKIQKNGEWANASKEEIKKYCILNEEDLVNYKYQLLSLSTLSGISEIDVRLYLADKGELKGKETIFMKAAEENVVNEIYLMAHACLETGNGTSKLATGVKYKGVQVYNMFVIKATDENPVKQGAAYAYKMGWTTPEKAILDGYISEQYSNHKEYQQDTLYKMRWNPNSPGTHQYASDIK